MTRNNSEYRNWTPIKKTKQNSLIKAPTKIMNKRLYLKETEYDNAKYTVHTTYSTYLKKREKKGYINTFLTKENKKKKISHKRCKQNGLQISCFNVSILANIKMWIKYVNPKLPGL